MTSVIVCRCVSRWQSNIPTHRQHLRPVKDFTEPWTCLPGPCAAPRTAAQRPCAMPKLSSYLQKERSDPQQQPAVSSVPVLETEWPSNHRGDVAPQPGVRDSSVTPACACGCRGMQAAAGAASSAPPAGVEPQQQGSDPYRQLTEQFRVQHERRCGSGHAGWSRSSTHARGSVRLRT